MVGEPPRRARVGRFDPRDSADAPESLEDLDRDVPEEVARGLEEGRDGVWLRGRALGRFATLAPCASRGEDGRTRALPALRDGAWGAYFDVPRPVASPDLVGVRGVDVEPRGVAARIPSGAPGRETVVRTPLPRGVPTLARALGLRGRRLPWKLTALPVAWRGTALREVARSSDFPVPKWSASTKVQPCSASPSRA